jgi:hypothetical protein
MDPPLGNASHALMSGFLANVIANYDSKFMAQEHDNKFVSESLSAGASASLELLAGWAPSGSIA